MKVSFRAYHDDYRLLTLRPKVPRRLATMRELTSGLGICLDPSDGAVRTRAARDADADKHKEGKR